MEVDFTMRQQSLESLDWAEFFNLESEPQFDRRLVEWVR
jgi:hypothetical protein